jgi:hypothetical protein
MATAKAEADAIKQRLAFPCLVAGLYGRSP